MSEQLAYSSANTPSSALADTAAPPTTGAAPAKQPPGGAIGFLTLSAMSQKSTRDIGLLILRVVSLCLILHGFHKLTGFSAFRDSLKEVTLGSLAPTPIGALVVCLQILLPVLLCLGLFTRWSGLVLAIMFGFIILAVNVPYSGWIGKQGGLSFEAALLYFLIGAVLFFTGPGSYSVDRILNRQE